MITDDFDHVEHIDHDCPSPFRWCPTCHTLDGAADAEEGMNEAQRATVRWIETKGWVVCVLPRDVRQKEGHTRAALRAPDGVCYAATIDQKGAYSITEEPK